MLGKEVKIDLEAYQEHVRNDEVSDYIYLEPYLDQVGTVQEKRYNNSITGKRSVYYLVVFNKGMKKEKTLFLYGFEIKELENTQ